MKLNPDCVRATLLYIENAQTISESGVIEPLKSWEICNKIQNFSPAEVIYSIKQLCEGSYLSSKVIDTQNFMCFIFDITPHGHEFLEDMRNDEVWNKTKETAKSVGSSSLSVLKQIASNVITAMITKRLGI